MLWPMDDKIPGSRGRVGNASPGGYELEIGYGQKASAEMVVFCAMIDEITEFLQKGESKVGYLLYSTWLERVDQLKSNIKCMEEAEIAAKWEAKQEAEQEANRTRVTIEPRAKKQKVVKYE
jgi:hypothetical protein